MGIEGEGEGVGIEDAGAGAGIEDAGAGASVRSLRSLRLMPGAALVTLREQARPQSNGAIARLPRPRTHTHTYI